MNENYERLLIRQNATPKNSLRITWLGTAGIYLTDGKTGILIDPYVSRFGIIRIALGLPLEPNRALVRQWTGLLGKNNIDAVIVSHSHFDHAADAPYFAAEAHAPLVGTESTLNIGRGCGLTENQLMAAQYGSIMRFGNFTVTFIESAHGPALLGRVPYPGFIDRPLVPPVKAANYRLGGVFALRIEHPDATVIHHGSAGFKPGMYDDATADILLLGIGGRGATDRYLENVALQTRARLVIPVHLDYFFKPLEAGMSLLPGVRFGEFLRQAKKYSSSFSLSTLPFCQEVALPLPEGPVASPVPGP